MKGRIIFLSALLLIGLLSLQSCGDGSGSGNGEDTITLADTDSKPEFDYDERLPEVFVGRLKAAGLGFEMPTGMIETPVIDNDLFPYDYALLDTMNGLEIRWAVKPGNEGKEQFENVVMDLTTGQVTPYTMFDPEGVKDEFNGDWGGTIAAEIEADFGQEYKECLIVFVRKEGLGGVYTIFLANEAQAIHDNIANGYHAAKFL